MKRLLGAGVVAVLACSFFAVPARAATTYTWSIDGSVANSGLPAGFSPQIALGPNVSSARNGTTLEIGGQGRFTPRGHWIDGGGDYRILDRSGKVLKQGRFRPVALSSYRDAGTEPEGSPVEQLRAGIIRARLVLEGLGTARLVFYCGVHDKAGNELEGVNVFTKRWAFTHIDAGSTTIQTI